MSNPKDRTLVGLNEGDDIVVNDEIKEVTTSNDTEETPQDINSILNSVTKKAQIKNEKIQVSIYLDEDVHKKYQKFGRKFSKGARSELVNELLRKALEDY